MLNFATLFLKVYFCHTFFKSVYKGKFMRLSLNDYISILKFYKIDVSRMKKKTIKQKAEEILAEKI